MKRIDPEGKTHTCKMTTEILDGKEVWVGTCEEYPDVKVYEDSFEVLLDSLDDVISALEEQEKRG